LNYSPEALKTLGSRIPFKSRCTHQCTHSGGAATSRTTGQHTYWLEGTRGDRPVMSKGMNDV